MTNLEESKEENSLLKRDISRLNKDIEAEE
jgi:hypothetical protein